MRRLLFLPILLVAANLWAQKPTISSANQQPFDNKSPYQLPVQFVNGFDSLRPRTFEDYLTYLAWQFSFDIESSSHDVEMKKQEIPLAKKDWTRNLNGSINFNDVSLPYFFKYNLGIDSIGQRRIDTTRFNRIATYPLWSIGLGVNFGDLVIRKHKVKVATERLKMSQADMNFKKQKLRGEVQKRYQELVATYEILKVRLQALDAAEAIKVQIANLFSLNKARLEDYNEANKNYFDALEAKVRAEAEIKIKKVGLEELIGYRWEQVEPLRANYEKK